MNKLLALLIGGFIFLVIILGLVPMLPTAYAGWVRLVIVFMAIIFLLGLAFDKSPWFKSNP